MATNRRTTDYDRERACTLLRNGATTAEVIRTIGLSRTVGFKLVKDLTSEGAAQRPIPNPAGWSMHCQPEVERFWKVWDSRTG